MPVSILFYSDVQPLSSPWYFSFELASWDADAASLCECWHWNRISVKSYVLIFFSMSPVVDESSHVVVYSRS